MLKRCEIQTKFNSPQNYFILAILFNCIDKTSLLIVLMVIGKREFFPFFPHNNPWNQKNDK